YTKYTIAQKKKHYRALRRRFIPHLSKWGYSRQLWIKSRDTSLIKLDFKKRVVANSIKIRRKRQKIGVFKPQKADQQKPLNCFF
ncbi:hypothetical protein PS405_08615, partial [Limosilactobacillus fermentum]